MSAHSGDEAAWRGPDLPPDLVGRESEMARMVAFLDGLEAGRSGLMIIHGEAGIGKTRLLAEVKELASARGVECLFGRCQERSRGVSYAPWIDVIREFVARSPKTLCYQVIAPNRGAVIRLVPELGGKVWLYEPAVDFEIAVDGSHFLTAISNVFLALSQGRPVLIGLDDLGWADAGTLALLAATLEIAGGARVAIVATYRDAHVEENPPLQKFLADALRARTTLNVEPRPLNPEELGRLIESAVGHRIVDRAFRETVHRRSGGNPFFAVEILASLGEEGRLSGAIARDLPPEDASLRIPVSVEATISHRLDRLDDTSRKALRVAALLGLEFSFALLESVAQLDEEKLLSALESGTRARLISERGMTTLGANYAFVHPLIQEVLSGEVGADRGRQIHRRAAQALEKQTENREDMAASIAYHYVRGVDGKAALHYTILAGDRAAQVHARSDAVGHYRTALGLLAVHPDPLTSAQVLQSLAQQLTILGDYGVAAKCLVDAAELQESLGNRVRGGFLRHQAALHTWAPREFRMVEDQLKAARSVMEAASPSPELATLYWDHANYLVRRCRYDEARPLFARSIEVTRAVGGGTPEAAIHLALGQIVGLGHRSEARHEVRTALQLTQDPSLALEAYHSLALMAGCGHADLAESRDWMQQGIAYALRHENPDWVAGIEGGAGCFAQYIEGDLRGSLTGSLAYEKFLLDHGQPVSGHNQLQLAGASLALGAIDEADRYVQASKEAFSEESGWYPALWFNLFSSRLEAARGDPSAAERTALLAIADYRQRGRLELDGFLEVLLLSDLVGHAILQSAFDRAQNYRNELKAIVGPVEGAPAEGYLARAEGRVALTLDQPTDAARWFHRSTEIWTQLGWKLELGRDLIDLAAVPDPARDPADGRRLQRRAVELLTEVGARPDLVRADSVASASERPPRRRSRGA